MAGLAANVDEAWRRSAKHLRDMALENESRLVSNRELAGRVAVMHPELVDAYKRVVPALDEKREAFRRRIQTRERSALERFRRIDQSRDEAVPFHDIGGGRADGGDGDDDGDGPFLASRKFDGARRPPALDDLLGRSERSAMNDTHRPRNWTDEPNRTCHSVRKKGIGSTLWWMSHRTNTSGLPRSSSTIRSREKAAMSHHGG